jgi:hypothetical protein
LDLQLVESLFQHKAKMVSLLDPHTHTFQLAQQADHVSDAEVRYNFERIQRLAFDFFLYVPSPHLIRARRQGLAFIFGCILCPTSLSHS